jgi:Bacteriophage head to tail connecting protein
MTGQQVLKIRDQLRVTRTALAGHWNDLSELFMPFPITQGSGVPNIPAAESVNDSTGRMVALILANGLASLVIPREESWYELLPPKAFQKDDRWVRAYREASVAMREYLERSNFYEEAQELLIENPVFGTGNMFVGSCEDADALYFKHQTIGSYDIAEDERGRVNTVGRDLRLTPDQAAAEFGVEKLPQKIASKVGKPEGLTEKSLYYHLVLPATTRADDDAPESSKKPWRMYVVEEVSKKLVSEGGYDEFPFAVPRYRKFGGCVWGFGPGTSGIADARQLEFLEKLADAAAEKAVFPPVVAPASLEGEIGQGALEVTFVQKPEEAAMLKEWSSAGRYDFAKDRLSDKRDQLRKVFHVDLFQFFSQRAQERGPLTATEASLVSNEKLSQFSPVFGRLVSEFLTPVLTRVFGILLRRNLLGQELATLVSKEGIPAPQILYKNKIMLAMQQRANQSLVDFVQLVAPLIQADPTLMDPINGPAIIRAVARNAGFDESWLRTPEAEQALKLARAQAQQAQAQAEQAATLAKAGRDLGQAPPDMRGAIAAMAQP